MAHFAKVNQGKVVQVIVAEPEFFETFVDNSPGEWIQTSYNTRGGVHYQSDSVTPSEDQSKSLRKNFAAVGYDYNEELDAFIAPKPFPSWTLDTETGLWVSPVAYPEGNDIYIWNESTQAWDLVPTE